MPRIEPRIPKGVRNVLVFRGFFYDMRCDRDEDETIRDDCYGLEFHAGKALRNEADERHHLLAVREGQRRA